MLDSKIDFFHNCYLVFFIIIYKYYNSNKWRKREEACCRMTRLKITYPKSFKIFQCLGGNCEDTCCKVWDIEIDKDTFLQYNKVNNEKMRLKLQDNISKNEQCISWDLDYGVIKLKDDNKCPFLDQNNYCSIYTEIGEEYLSNICTNYPRILNKVDNQYEISLDVSCPEAARLVLGDKNGIQFETGEHNFIKYIINDEYNTNSKKYRNSLIKYLKEIRHFSMGIMGNRNFTLSERFYILGDFIGKLVEKSEENSNEILKLIEEYNVYKRAESYKIDEKDYIFQIILFMNIINSSKVGEKTSSEALRNYTNEVLNGFNIKNIADIKKNAERYMKEFKKYEQEVMEKNSYIFENYFVNFMYNNLFPFSESDDAFEGYIMFLMRFAFIRFYLVGMYFNKQEDSPENIIKFIQIFARDIEHDKSFIPELLNYIIENKYDNKEFINKLL